MYNELHNGCMIMFSSSTAVQKAERLLADRGIWTEQTRPPSGLSGGSCAYALNVQRGDVQRALWTLGNMRHGAVFCMVNGGWRKL